jgi:hypothetical protein
MKNWISSILLFAFILMNISKLLILIHYEFNKAEITEKYCVNKDKPQMHCCGKCQLKKKLAEADEQQKYPSFPDVKIDIILYSNLSDAAFMFNLNNGIFLSSMYSGKYSKGTLPGIFHPPSC